MSRNCTTKDRHFSAARKTIICNKSNEQRGMFEASWLWLSASSHKLKVSDAQTDIANARKKLCARKGGQRDNGRKEEWMARTHRKAGRKYDPPSLPRGNRNQRANIAPSAKSSTLDLLHKRRNSGRHGVDGGPSRSRGIWTDSTSERGKNEHNHRGVTLS